MQEETASKAWFEDVSDEVGPVFKHISGHSNQFLFPEIMGGGVAIFDLEGDGDLDLYFVQSGVLAGKTGQGNQLWRNISNGSSEGGGLEFEDITTGSGADDAGYGMGVTAGDYDNDGDVDLYVTNVGPNVLLQNQGDGTFHDVSEAAGVGDRGWGTSAAFLDFDADGDLDLYVANYVVWSLEGDLRCFSQTGQPDYCSPVSYNAPQPDVLYRNQGGGVFTDVSIEVGLRSAFGNGLGVAWGDLDDDGTMDIFVANDQVRNQLWRNRGGKLEDVATEMGCAVDENGQAKAGMGTLAADLDDDGDLDLLVVNLQTQSDSFYRNEGSYFVDESSLIGLGTASRPYTRFGVGWVDFDNDGHPDLYQATGRVTMPNQQSQSGTPDDPFAEINLLLRGQANGRFEPVSPAGGTVEPVIRTSRAAAFGDLDNDGGVDVVVVNKDAGATILRNVVSGSGHWIRFRVLDANGRDALGAVVTLRIGDRTLRRDVRVAYSYCASNDVRVHVGLGEFDVARDVEVLWPDGRRKSLGDLTADEDYVIR